MRDWYQRNRSVVCIGGATAFSLLGDQVLYAVLPVYYESLGLTPIQVGILLSANRWIRLITNELAHRISRPGTERPLFSGAFALGALTTAAYFFTSYFVVLFVARLLWGLAWSLIRHIGVQNVLREVPANRVGQTMGLYNGLSRAGSVAGLLGGSILVDLLGFGAGVMMLAAVSLLSLPLAGRGLAVPATVQPGAVTGDGEVPATMLILGFTLGAVGPGFVMGTLGASLAGYVPGGAYFSAATLTGALLAARYLMDTLAAPWLGSATDRFGLRRAAAAFFLIGGLALTLSALTPPLWVFIAAILTFFLSGTALQAGVAGTAGRLGSAAYARYVTASDFGSASGPLLGWLVVAWLDSAAWSLALGALAYLLATPVALSVRELKQHPRPAGH